jgi:hypothetical protein
VFDIAATYTVGISALTIADGLVIEPNGGGGIFNAGTLTLTNSTVSGNFAGGAAGSYPTAAGGGIYNGGALTVTGSTLRGNSALGVGGANPIALGGGIFNGGALTVTNSTLSGNSASASGGIDEYPGRGGGIFNGGALTLTSSTLSGNSASGSFSTGGGIDNGGGGTLIVTNSTFSGNSAASDSGRGDGGGINNNNFATLIVTSSTFSGNSASRSGGGIANYSQATVTSSILSGNSATYYAGGGIYNLNGTLTLTSSTLSGNSAPGGGGIDNAGMLTVTSSALSGNSVTGLGGGIANESRTPLTVTNSTLSGNSATAGGGIANEFDASGTVTLIGSTVNGNSGGGIFNEGGGPLSLTGCTVSGNSGSGIDNDVGTMTLTGSTVSGNSANFGGGISNYATLTVTSSTVSGNSAISSDYSYGGGIYNVRMMTLTSSTVSGNSAGLGGGIFSLEPVTTTNTILAGNTAPTSPDVSGPLDSQGHNLIGDGSGGSGYDPSDLVGTSSSPIDPKLGPLQDNGGPTQTMALLPGSPAIDAGDNAASPGPYDQRGPGFARIVNGTIDIGAFEVQAALTVHCSVTTPVLWPPNHQLVNVGLSVQVSDPNATVTVQVFADDGAVPADAAGLAPGTLRLRADRQGNGSGRVYLVVVTATDAFGDTATSACTVVVPHDHSTRALAAVEQQAADAAAYFLAFHTAPPGYRPLG